MSIVLLPEVQGRVRPLQQRHTVPGRSAPLPGRRETPRLHERAEHAWSR